MGDLLNDEIELVRSFSLCESLEQLGRPSPRPGGVFRGGSSAHIARANPSGTAVCPEDIDDDFFLPVSAASCASDASGDAAASSGESQPPADQSERIAALEAENRLLRAQNAQLLVNSCALYNTLLVHIEKLREQLRDRDTGSQGADPPPEALTKSG